MAAGIAALEELSRGDAYRWLEQLGALLEVGLTDAAKAAGVPVRSNRCGSMFCAYFTPEPVHNLADAMKSDRERFKKYFHGMLEEGVYLAPSQFEARFPVHGAQRGGRGTDGERSGKGAQNALTSFLFS